MTCSIFLAQILQVPVIKVTFWCSTLFFDKCRCNASSNTFLLYFYLPSSPSCFILPLTSPIPLCPHHLLLPPPPPLSSSSSSSSSWIAATWKMTAVSCSITAAKTVITMTAMTTTSVTAKIDYATVIAPAKTTAIVSTMTMTTTASPTTMTTTTAAAAALTLVATTTTVMMRDHILAPSTMNSCTKYMQHNIEGDSAEGQ